MIEKLPMFLGRAPIVSMPGNEGLRMYVGSDICDTVVAIGYENTTKPGGIDVIGTGFLLAYDNASYLITARHVASVIDEYPFVIRANRNKEEGSDFINLDQVEWFFHDDPLVDIAITPLSLTRALGYRALMLPEEMLVTKDKWVSRKFGVGDFCYTVGLFHFITGEKRNLPIVYTGHIGLIPSESEKIPVYDRNSKSVQKIQAVLIECGAINGASGAPVLVRGSYSLETPHPPFKAASVTVPVGRTDIDLLGIFVGSWFLPPDAVLRESIMASPSDKVPVGLGIVVPCYRIVEVLENEVLREQRLRGAIASAAETTS